MAGKAPLLLAAFLFGIGASGLFLLSFAERTDWGPFRPRMPFQPPQRVIVLDVGTPFTPPPLEGLLAGRTEQRLDALSAEEAGGAASPEAEGPAATPTPIPPIRIHGVAASDGVSAAGATPTAPPPLRIVNVAADEAAAGETTPASETPAGGAEE